MIASLALPVTLDLRVGPVQLRRSCIEDLPELMRLLADDTISPGRGDRAAEVDVDLYRQALASVIADPSNELVVAVDSTDQLIGTLQLTRIPGLSRRGSTRLQVEAVRVSSRLRSSGIGSAMIRWVLTDAAPATDAALVQLTSDARREDAHRFYERLGFTGSHRGYKYRVLRPARD